MLFAFFAWLAYDNFASTGHAAVSAYQLWRQQQSVVPSFLWQPLRKTVPIYYSLQTQQFNTVWEMSYWNHLHQNIALGFLRVMSGRFSFCRSTFGHCCCYHFSYHCSLPTTVNLTNGDAW